MFDSISRPCGSASRRGSYPTMVSLQFRSEGQVGTPLVNLLPLQLMQGQEANQTLEMLSIVFSETLPIYTNTLRLQTARRCSTVSPSHVCRIGTRVRKHAARLAPAMSVERAKRNATATSQHALSAPPQVWKNAFIHSRSKPGSGNSYSRCTVKSTVMRNYYEKYLKKSMYLLRGKS